MQAGDSVILGASKKDDDWKRWGEAPKYIRPDLNLLAGEEYAVDPLKSTSNVRAEVNLSAGDLRDLISDVVENPDNEEAKKQLSEYIPADKINVLFSILGLPAPSAEESLRRRIFRRCSRISRPLWDLRRLSQAGEKEKRRKRRSRQKKM